MNKEELDDEVKLSEMSPEIRELVLKARAQRASMAKGKPMDVLPKEKRKATGKPQIKKAYRVLVRIK